MATTPPPPKRIRTPPTPLHGPQHDTYEPYSPRRSTRIAKLHSNLSSPNQSWNSASSSSAAINSARSVSGTFSPPQSPISPVKRSNNARGGRLDALTPRKQRKVQIYEDRESDSDVAVPVPQSSKGTRVTHLGAGMLPTPSKTPRKRVVSQEIVQSTSRVLFPGRVARPEDAMPPTRRSRKNLMFSLDGLDEDGDDEAGSIPIYTDSKDRVPDLDEGEDNPFVVRKSKARANEASHNEALPVVRRSTRRANGYDEEVEEMERKVRNDEGMIYVFRGRKVFRRFDNRSDDADAAESQAADAPHNVNEFIKRKAGAAATERFTRSSVTPRLLFPNAEQQLEREERARREEEEAITDIEVHEDEATADESTMTPAKDDFNGPTTPPSTTRKGRAHVDQDDEEMSVAIPVPESELDISTSSKSKVSPFDSWKRTKAGARAPPKGTKRERDVEAPEPQGSGKGKRARSGTFTQAPQ